MDDAGAARVALSAVAVLVLWLLLMREAWRAWQPARLLLQGRYAAARAAAERVERSWMRVFRSVRLSSRYVIACSLHLEGDLEASLSAVAAMHHERHLRGNIRDAVRSIEAANLVLLERTPARAVALLEEMPKLHRPAEDVLLAAHAKLGLRDPEAAQQLFTSAGAERSARRLRLGSVLLIEDRRQQEAIFHALRGLFLVKMGRADDAQTDLEIAARSVVTNVYVERARAVLQAKAAEADDPRSSLAPQVLAKESSSDS